MFSTIPVLATNNTINYDETVSIENVESIVDFSASKGSTFLVCLPKEITLVDNQPYTMKAGFMPIQQRRLI